ncbi:hypothetical protein HDU96_001837 [Phlyctochytrium bullatum]|nr:hypothetical protein HDU96_001837 [Phlyctochytrium bullatum]
MSTSTLRRCTGVASSMLLRNSVVTAVPRPRIATTHRFITTLHSVTPTSVTVNPSPVLTSLQRTAQRNAANAAMSQKRGIVRIPLANMEQGKEYMKLRSAEKQAFVPKPRGKFQDPASFLTAIGRKCEDYAAKFTSWDHLFTATTDEMGTLGIPTKARKYIAGWREWYKRGRDPYNIPIPKRAKKYLKLKAKVKLLRLQREGKA